MPTGYASVMPGFRWPGARLFALRRNGSTQLLRNRRNRRASHELERGRRAKQELRRDGMPLAPPKCP